jgi:transcription initiation factor TFIIH subunit 3
VRAFSFHSKFYSGDVILVIVIMDTNHFFWAAAALPFTDSFTHSNSLLLLDHLNHVIISRWESTLVPAP